MLQRLDEIAKADYTTRSDIIRQAVLFYIRSTGAVLSPGDAAALFQEMKNRQLRAYLKAVNQL